MTMPIHIAGGQVLCGGSLAATDVTLADGRIAALGKEPPPGALILDARGRLVLPGMIDIHGDAFERQIMPRPNVRFDQGLALADTDRQLAANGITTAFHGLTISWEPGLRSLAGGRAFMAALAAARPSLGVDHRVQIRWETHALDALDDVASWLADEIPPALAFNDHTTATARMLETGRAPKLADWASRAGLSVDAYLALVETVMERSTEVGGAMAQLAAAAQRAGIVMLSHDDRTLAERASFRALGATICEFPLTREAADAARSVGEHTVFGAPNIVRGGSHMGALDAAEMVLDGAATILASDYHYPSLLAAVSRLVGERGMALAEAFWLVSTAPAEALGLPDRGAIETGLRADIVIANRTAGALTVAATIAAGRLACLADGTLLTQAADRADTSPMHGGPGQAWAASDQGRIGSDPPT